MQKEEMKKYNLKTANTIQNKIDQINSDQSNPTIKTTKIPKSKPIKTKKRILIGEYVIDSKESNPIEIRYRGQKFWLSKGQKIVLVPNGTGRWRTNPNRAFCDYKGHPNDRNLRMKYSIGGSSFIDIEKDRIINIINSGILKIHHNDKGVRDNEGSIKVKIFLLIK